MINQTKFSSEKKAVLVLRRRRAFVVKRGLGKKRPSNDGETFFLERVAREKVKEAHFVSDMQKKAVKAVFGIQKAALGN